MRSRDLLGDVEPPTALAALAAEPDLQSRMRSYTGCYFDLGDTAVRTTTGGTLLHLVSDQQWVRHWLVLLGSDGQSPVLSTTLPLGFELGEDQPDEEPIPDIVRLDGSLDLSVSADTVEEFLYRLWIENEIAFRASAHDALPEPFASYAASVGRRKGVGAAAPVAGDSLASVSDSRSDDEYGQEHASAVHGE